VCACRGGDEGGERLTARSAHAQRSSAPWERA
jgi:hypothetical protein